MYNVLQFILYFGYEGTIFMILFYFKFADLINTLIYIFINLLKYMLLINESDNVKYITLIVLILGSHLLTEKPIPQ